MAEAKRPPLEKVLTPTGIAKFPHLNKPDTKFNKDGEYRIRLILAAEEAAPIVDKMKAAADKAFNETKAELEASIKSEKGEKLAKAKEALKKLKLADLPMKPVYDDDGEETGHAELSFKMKAQRKDKEGKVIKMVPKLFDSKGAAFPLSKDIWGGSKVKVAAQIVPFYTAAVGAGASLRLSAVQIIELSSGSGGTADSFGFGKEEGYEADPTDMEREGFSEGSDAPEDGPEEF